MQLREHCVEVAEVAALLVRVLAVAQLLAPVQGQAQGAHAALVEVVEDVTVVGTRHGKGLSCQPLALLKGGHGLAAVALEHLQQWAVLCPRGHDGHVVEVLGSRAYERNAAYVYLLDDFLLARTAGHCVLKGVEVDDHKVDFRNLVFFHLLLVACVVATTQDAPKHLGVQRFHSATQYRRVACEIFNCLAGIACLLYKLLGAPSREKFHPAGVEYFENVLKPVFVKDRDEGGFYFFCFSHIPCYITPVHGQCPWKRLFLLEVHQLVKLFRLSLANQTTKLLNFTQL